MTQRIEFTNQPPTVAQCPKLELRLLARGLVEATRNYKLHTKEKNDEEIHEEASTLRSYYRGEKVQRDVQPHHREA